jgi:hypothetical protein
MEFNVNTFDVTKYDSILQLGLSHGMGEQGGQMCIEAAICYTLGLPHSDDPRCVAKSVRAFKIRLNDKKWSSPQARAKGLRDLGLAQLGSLGIVNDKEFVTKLAEKTIRILIPKLFRSLPNSTEAMLATADRCELEGADAAIYAVDAAADAAAAADADAADAAIYAADAIYAAAIYANTAYAAAIYANAAAVDAAAAAANAAANAAYANAAANAAAAAAYANAAKTDEYLILSANLALEILKELKSPGCELLNL